MFDLSACRDRSGKLVAHVWPGGYPVFYLDEENNALCPGCANKTNAAPVACDANWENPNLYCDDCGRRIESAYAED